MHKIATTTSANTKSTTIEKSFTIYVANKTLLVESKSKDKPPKPLIHVSSNFSQNTLIGPPVFVNNTKQRFPTARKLSLDDIKPPGIFSDQRSTFEYLSHQKQIPTEVISRDNGIPKWIFPPSLSPNPPGKMEREEVTSSTMVTTRKADFIPENISKLGQRFDEKISVNPVFNLTRFSFHLI